jgi:hypothetical protein
VRRLLADVGSAPFIVRSELATPLRTHVAGNLGTMTRAEQAAAFAQLDANVRSIDVELWRAKQVNDFLAGIWAQGYGQIYLDGINAFFRLQRASRVLCILSVVAAGWIVVPRRLRPASADPNPDDSPQPSAVVPPG